MKPVLKMKTVVPFELVGANETVESFELVYQNETVVSFVPVGAK